MVRVAITGHVHLSDETATWVVDALRRRLSQLVGSGVHGITCLAPGVDQLFARVVLGLPGTFEVVLPARDYPARMRAEGSGEEFQALLSHATDVEMMPYETSTRDAYVAASETMLSRCDLLLAAWDGNPSRRPGDTADVVRLAHTHKLPVEILWPVPRPAAARDPG
jgi:hypothetical protein